MPSDRKIAANRNNARKSTGPRSKEGREASRRNALRHGLAIEIGTDPKLQDDIQKLAKALSLSSGIKKVSEHAREAAEAALDLKRIRKVRAFLLETRIFETQTRPARADCEVAANASTVSVPKHERYRVGGGGFEIGIPTRQVSAEQTEIDDYGKLLQWHIGSGQRRPGTGARGILFLYHATVRTAPGW
jgi:hypothetical protein